MARSRIPKALELVLPATSANLGPAFDAAALAFGLSLRVKAVPDQLLSTEEARRVLPQQYSRADAVTNIQNSMMLLAAMVYGRTDLLANALADRIHQPYRASLCPLLPALDELVGKSGILGVAL